MSEEDARRRLARMRNTEDLHDRLFLAQWEREENEDYERLKKAIREAQEQEGMVTRRHRPPQPFPSDHDHDLVGVASNNASSILECRTCQMSVTVPQGTYLPEEFPHQHVYSYVNDEYNSLAQGGSYEVYRCQWCGRMSYRALPD